MERMSVPKCGSFISRHSKSFRHDFQSVDDFGFHVLYFANRPQEWINDEIQVAYDDMNHFMKTRSVSRWEPVYYNSSKWLEHLLVLWTTSQLKSNLSHLAILYDMCIDSAYAGKSTSTRAFAEKKKDTLPTQ